MGGQSSLEAGKQNLEAFWSQYQKIHPEHDMFRDPTHRSRWPTTLACALHGDEGRGLKKGQTCVLMLESTLGLEPTPGRKRKAEVACECRKR